MSATGHDLDGEPPVDVEVEACGRPSKAHDDVMN
jgi:hypothetical protein